MSAIDSWDDEAFIGLMADLLPEQPMTHEKVAREAIADNRSEIQAERMQMWNFQN